MITLNEARALLKYVAPQQEVPGHCVLNETQLINLIAVARATDQRTDQQHEAMALLPRCRSIIEKTLYSRTATGEELLGEIDAALSGASKFEAPDIITPTMPLDWPVPWSAGGSDKAREHQEPFGFFDPGSTSEQGFLSVRDRKIETWTDPLYYIAPDTAAMIAERDAKIKRLEDETADWYQSDKALRDRIEALEAERDKLLGGAGWLAQLVTGEATARIAAERALAEKIEQAALICDKIAEMREQGAGLINGPGSRLRQAARMIRELAVAPAPGKVA